MRKTTLRAAGIGVLGTTLLIAGPAAFAATWTVTAGNDTRAGTDVTDTFWGRGGDDRLFGAGGNDTLHGEEGADHLFGQLGSDVLNGNTGADYLSGGGGRDELNGGHGDDRIYADEESDAASADSGDRAAGGPDDATVFSRDREGAHVECGGGARDDVVADRRDTIGAGCERVRRAADGDDRADTLAERSVEWARAFVGMTEAQLWNAGYFQPWVHRTGNSTSGPGDPDWCGIFAHEAYFQAGRDLPNDMDYTNWLYSTTSSSFTTVAETNTRRGDLVLLDWNRDGDPDHIGLAGKDYASGDGGIVVVSGNSSDSVTERVETLGEVIRVRRVS